MTMRERERGWALISVLWMLSILALLVATAEALSFVSALRERRALADAEIDAALDAGIVRAVVGIRDSRPPMRWRVDGVPQTFTLNGETLRVAVQDEYGRIDLNAADGSLLNQLLRTQGLAKERAEALTDDILDWRGADTGFARLHGAGAAGYAGAGLPYHPRHGAFQSVDELRLVLGMTPELFARLRPALTVYSHHPAIETATAPRQALLAYYPGQAERVDELLEARVVGPAGNTGTLADASGLAGRSFDITVTCMGNGQARTREAVIMLTNSSDRPFLVMWWR